MRSKRHVLETLPEMPSKPAFETFSLASDTEEEGQKMGIPQLFAIEEEGCIFGNETNVGETRSVCPVGTGHAAGGSSFMLTQLLKDAAIPKFSGEPCDFDDFRWQFERHITNIESAQKEKFRRV